VRSTSLLLLALFSGSAALIYETIWLRWFRLLFGSTAHAASATLCAFFAGLALGALLFGAVAGRSRRPLLLYAAIEAGAAATALVVPAAIWLYEPIYAALYERLADSRGLFVAVKFGLGLVAMLPTATLLGGTLPALAAAFIPDTQQLGRRANTLYAVNTLGAVGGSAAGALWLPEQIGVSATYGVAVSISLLLAAAASLAGRGAPSPLPARVRSHATPWQASAPASLLVIAFASGFGTLAFEVFMTHGLALTLMSSLYSFGAVMIVVLLSIALGAFFVAFTSGRVAARRLLVFALVVQSLMLLAAPWLMARAFVAVEVTRAATFWSGLELALTFGGPPLLVASLVLPLAIRLSEAPGGSAAPQLGGLLAANTIGGIVGSILAGFVALDLLGLWSSIALLGVGYGLAAVALGSTPAARLVPAAIVCCALLATWFSPANPLALPVARAVEHERVLDVREGAYGVVSVTENWKGDRHLRVDNQYMLAGSLAQTHQERMGQLPLILHGNPSRVLYIGSATGATASAAVAHPVDEIVLVELVPQVQELAALHFARTNHGIYQDPRTRRVVEDGRNHVRGSPELYDVIVTDLFVPWRPGVGAMYSVDHFDAVRRHLAPGGVCALWLPIYQLNEELFEILASSFLAVFPDATLWRGDFYALHPTAALIGIAGEAPSVVEVDTAIASLRDSGNARDRWISHASGLWMLYLGPLSGALDAGAAELNTDASPIFEYRAGRASETSRQEFLAQGWPALSQRVLDLAGVPDPIFPGRPTAAAQAGIDAARASAPMLGSQGGKRLGAAERQAARQLLLQSIPAELSQPPDNSVSEVWTRLMRRDDREHTDR
jgi:spermidine synthase